MSDFWSRRRAAVEAEAEAEANASAARVRAAEREELEAQSDEEALAALDLPDPDGCDDPAILRKFLNETVPARLKTRALRRMWRLNPVLANLDGLVDYGADYTDAATVIENLQTTYQVGKGMLRALTHETPAPVEPDVEHVTEAEDICPEHDPSVEAEGAAPAALAENSHAPNPEHIEDDSPAPTPRRMRFAFAETI